jgi:cell division protein FtsW
VNVHRTSVYLLIVTVIGLIALGLVMMSSTSAYAPESHGDATFLLRRQAEWLALGVCVFAVAAALDYHLLEKTWWIWFAVALALLALCFAPHFCHRINGSRRWIQLGALRFQPSEFGKLAAVAAVAWVLSRDAAHPRQFLRGFLAPLGLSGVLMAAILPEVDLGCTALIGTTTFILMFIAGTRLRYLVPMVVAGASGIFLVAMKMPERTGRLLAYLHPDKYPAEAFQGLQGMIALGSGGVEGLGLGNGRQKMMYLPFAHTDFIFPVIGEELGLRFTLAVVFAYILFILCGAVIAMRARDRFGMLLGFGVTVIIALQAAINIGVTTAILPNKGLPLPFISYGGTNLVFCLLGVGILVNIYRHGVTDKEEKSGGGVALHARVRKPLRMVRL